MYLKFAFKRALHFSKLAIKLLTVVQSCFKPCVIVNATLWTSLLSNASPSVWHKSSTFKTNVLCLVSDEGQVKCLLLLYKRLIQPHLSYNWRCILPFSTCMTHPFLKTKVLCLVSNEGWVKHLLLLYKWLKQHYFSLLWL